MKALSVLSALLVLGSTVHSRNIFSQTSGSADRKIRFEDVVESCKPVSEAKNVEPNWESTKFNLGWQDLNYHAPVASAGDIYRVTQQFMGHNDFKTVRMSDLVNSCFRITLDDATGLKRSFHGFNNKHFVKELTPVPNHQMTLTYPAPFAENFGATITVVDTDNESYWLVVLCHEDQMGSWAALSPFPTLSEQAIKRITKKISSMGFKKENTIRLNYPDTCEMPGIQDGPS